jgi:hypothetical protein
LPSIEQVMPWLHMIFDAWEDHRRQREHEAAERAAHEAAERAAAEALAFDDESNDPEDEGDHKNKKKKKHKHKDKE